MRRRGGDDELDDDWDDEDDGPDAPAAVPRGPTWRGRLARRLALPVLVVAVLAGGLTWRLFVRPPTHGPVRADAIVMFGGSGDRFDRALELAQDGYADTVVVSDAIDDGGGYSAYGFFCRNDGENPEYPEIHDFEAICFEPDPLTTRGEARYVAELAEERGWDRIDLVTTTEQATRARMLLARCWDGDIASVTVPTSGFPPARIVYEWGAMARAVLQRRDC